eukprot:scaffold346_cov116-Cylindrotheca_fusiformis.AAC.1
MMRTLGFFACFSLAISQLTTSAAWFLKGSVPGRSTVHLMASRGAAKWQRKQEWLARRESLKDQASDHSVAFSAIIGSGRIGSTLASAGNCVVLGREDKIDADGSGPILVATRNDALDGIIDHCPENRKQDLVFMQNGYLDAYLDSKGLLQNTQVLLYLSVAAMGADPVDGVTSANPEGLTAATGVHAQAFADRLAALDLKCNVVDMASYKPAMFEKLVWISVYMLVGAAKGCSTVGEAGSDHGEIVTAVVNELIAAISAKEGITFSNGTMERLAAYTDVVSDFPAAVKEFEWRNKYFYDMGNDAVPIHNALMRECAEKGLLGFDLP